MVTHGWGGQPWALWVCSLGLPASLSLALLAGDPGRVQKGRTEEESVVPGIPGRCPQVSRRCLLLRPLSASLGPEAPDPTGLISRLLGPGPLIVGVGGTHAVIPLLHSDRPLLGCAGFC